MPVHASPHVELGMYPFESVRWAWDELWAAVHGRTPWTPPALTWSGDTHARWDDTNCLVTQVCGAPYIATYRDEFDVIGAFALDIPEAGPGDARYRSVIVSTTDLPLVERDFSTVRAAANSADSLSGWHSLRAATVGAGAPWPGTVTFTGAHRESLGVLVAGGADIASIDPWSLAFIESEQPELVGALHRIGLGPSVPSPPIAIRTSASESQRSELRAAFADTMLTPAVADALSALHIEGFVGVSADDYHPLVHLLSGS